MDKMAPYIYNQYKDIFDLETDKSYPHFLSLISTPYYFTTCLNTRTYVLRTSGVGPRYTITSVKQMVKMIRLLGVLK